MHNVPVALYLTTFTMIDLQISMSVLALHVQTAAHAQTYQMGSSAVVHMVGKGLTEPYVSN